MPEEQAPFPSGPETQVDTIDQATRALVKVLLADEPGSEQAIPLTRPAGAHPEAMTPVPRPGATVQIPATLVLHGFPIEGDQLPPEWTGAIEFFVERLVETPELQVDWVIGRASQTGPEYGGSATAFSGNVALAEQRAQQVWQFMEDRLTDALGGRESARERLGIPLEGDTFKKTVSYGSEDPIVDAPGVELDINRSVTIQYSVPLGIPDLTQDQWCDECVGTWNLDITENALINIADYYNGGYIRQPWSIKGGLYQGKLKNIDTGKQRRVVYFAGGPEWGFLHNMTEKAAEWIRDQIPPKKFSSSDKEVFTSILQITVDDFDTNSNFRAGTGDFEDFKPLVSVLQVGVGAGFIVPSGELSGFLFLSPSIACKCSPAFAFSAGFAWGLTGIGAGIFGTIGVMLVMDEIN